MSYKDDFGDLDNAFLNEVLNMTKQESWEVGRKAIDDWDWGGAKAQDSDVGSTQDAHAVQALASAPMPTDDHPSGDAPLVAERSEDSSRKAGVESPLERMEIDDVVEDVPAAAEKAQETVMGSEADALMEETVSKTGEAASTKTDEAGIAIEQGLEAEAFVIHAPEAASDKESGISGAVDTLHQGEEDDNLSEDDDGDDPVDQYFADLSDDDEVMPSKSVSDTRLTSEAPTNEVIKPWDGLERPVQADKISDVSGKDDSNHADDFTVPRVLDISQNAHEAEADEDEYVGQLAREMQDASDDQAREVQANTQATTETVTEEHTKAEAAVDSPMDRSEDLNSDRDIKRDSAAQDQAILRAEPNGDTAIETQGEHKDPTQQSPTPATETNATSTPNVDMSEDELASGSPHVFSRKRKPEPVGEGTANDAIPPAKKKKRMTRAEINFSKRPKKAPQGKAPAVGPRELKGLIQPTLGTARGRNGARGQSLPAIGRATKGVRTREASVVSAKTTATADGASSVVDATDTDMNNAEGEATPAHRVQKAPPRKRHTMGGRELKGLEMPASWKAEGPAEREKEVTRGAAGWVGKNELKKLGMPPGWSADTGAEKGRGGKRR